MLKSLSAAPRINNATKTQQTLPTPECRLKHRRGIRSQTKGGGSGGGGVGLLGDITGGGGSGGGNEGNSDSTGGGIIGGVEGGVAGVLDSSGVSSTTRTMTGLPSERPSNKEGFASSTQPESTQSAPSQASENNTWSSVASNIFPPTATPNTAEKSADPPTTPPMTVSLTGPPSTNTSGNPPPHPATNESPSPYPATSTSPQQSMGSLGGNTNPRIILPIILAVLVPTLICCIILIWWFRKRRAITGTKEKPAVTPFHVDRNDSMNSPESSSAGPAGPGIAKPRLSVHNPVPRLFQSRYRRIPERSKASMKARSLVGGSRQNEEASRSQLATVLQRLEAVEAAVHRPDSTLGDLDSMARGPSPAYTDLPPDYTSQFGHTHEVPLLTMQNCDLKSGRADS
ncbi:hypothetical protein D9756_007911 [Leucocoprinus leucothites]|uniref:Uncharacterized protein n=1 Tax=Leucocoprinus leucothites TaxID=201217 RepID=A0A8H5FYB9_9AGAR|nr:hypothetical protein D9756_007911 [Leucoagaricus leucothites]